MNEQDSVQFDIVFKRRSSGRTQEIVEHHVGKIVMLRKTAAVIEAENGGLYNRPLNEIAPMEKEERL